MKVFIEFDTDVNDSFAYMGATEHDVISNVLDHLSHSVKRGRIEEYNVIRYSADDYPIGMFKVTKS